MNKNEPTLIKNILTNKHSKLNNILKKASDLKKINEIFQTTLNSDLAKHCYLAEYSPESITLVIDNASWATQLRYNIPDIIKILKNKPEFKKIKNINYKITTKY